jgi:hypothetical protein
MRTSLRVAFALLVAAACGKGKGSDRPVPAQPRNGSPVAVEFGEFIPGKRGEGRGVRAHVYNLGDKKAAGYVILARYYDKDGKLLKVKPGTPFEKDSEFMSLAGRKYMCEPKAWATLDIDMFEAPAEAVKAELVASKVDAVGADGMKVEDWFSQPSWSDWPE